jgi:hypothetical protein
MGLLTGTGVYKLGGYYDTARFTDLVTGASDRGNGSVYVLGDQTLYTGADGVPTVCTPIFDRPRMTTNRRSDGLAAVVSAAATAGSEGDTALRGRPRPRV